MEEAAQLSLAKRLAHSSDKAIRDEAFKTLALWLEGNKSANEDEYLKVWKALFYSMWYSDKIPVQQELAFNIARLTRSLKGDSRAVLFLSTFFATLSREWIGIDHLRMDKYLSLTRRMLHEAIRLTAQASFSAETLAAVEGLLAAVLAGRPNGIRYHIVDCFLEEVGAAAPGIRTEQLQRLLAPLYAHCVVTDDRFLYERVAKEVVQGLVQRTSDAQAPASEDADAEEGAAGAVKASESPLLIDAAARRAALASAFKQIKLAPIARDVFSLAAFSCTQGSHRERLYALHKEAAAAALALGHAEEEGETYPRPVGTPTPTVQRAIEIASARSGRKLNAEAAAAAAAVVKAAEAAVEKATVSAAAKAKSLEAHRKKKEQRKKWREEAAAAGPDVDDAAEEEAAEAKAAAASAAAGGAKRSRREMERAAAAAAGGVGSSEFAGAEIRGSKRARATEAAAAAAAGAGSEDEEGSSGAAAAAGGAAAKPAKGKKAAGAAGKAGSGAARAAPPAAAAEAEEGASVAKAAPRSKKGKSADSSAPAAAAPAAEEAGEGDAMALLAAIPTVGQLKKGKAPTAKVPAAAPAAEEEAPSAAAAPSKKAPAGILKAAAPAGKAGKAGKKGR